MCISVNVYHGFDKVLFKSHFVNELKFVLIHVKQKLPFTLSVVFNPVAICYMWRQTVVHSKDKYNCISLKFRPKLQK